MTLTLPALRRTTGGHDPAGRAYPGTAGRTAWRRTQAAEPGFTDRARRPLLARQYSGVEQPGDGRLFPLRWRRTDPADLPVTLCASAARVEEASDHPLESAEKAVIAEVILEQGGNLTARQGIEYRQEHPL